MPEHGLPWRRQDVSIIGVTNGNGGQAELTLPMLEGQLLLPRFITLSHNGNAGLCMFALSHHLTHANLPNGNISVIDDPTIWIWHRLDAVSPTTVRLDLRDWGVELAGPQTFLVHNQLGGTNDFIMQMHYDVKKVGDLEWAANARVTSFED